MRIAELVKDMRRTGRQLAPFSFPTVSKMAEAHVSVLKQKTTCVNGYHVGLYYGEALHDPGRLESFQVFGKSHPDLPFSLVWDLTTKFLGGTGLTLITVPYAGPSVTRKIYVWTVYYDASGNTLDSPHQPTEKCWYKGQQYWRAESSGVNFF